MKVSRGFTLIEMLVSLSIFAIVTAFATANFRTGRQSDELRIGANIVATTLRRAQTMAIAGQTTLICRGGASEGKTCLLGPSACPGGVCADEVPKGYGVRFVTADSGNTKMSIFADIDGDRAMDTGEEVRRDSLAAGPFMVVSAFTPDASGVLDVVFEPPRPKVWYNGDDSVAVAEVIIKHIVTDRTRRVTANAVSGQISAE